MNTKNRNITDIVLMDKVTGTTTSTEGVALFLLMDKTIKSGKVVRLSLHGSTPLSSSFLNATFGELYDKYGISKIRTSIVLVNYLPSHAKTIKKYLENVEKLVK